MNDKVKLLGIKAITSLHVGAGRGLGHIDLPVAREKATNFPYLPGSALKGVMRDKYEKQGVNNSKFDLAFGKKENNSDETTAGKLIFADARLLALPIRSFFGTFAAVSCPMIINRLYADFKAFGFNDAESKFPPVKDAEIAVRTDSPLKKDEKVYLEDVDFTVAGDVKELVKDLKEKFPNFGTVGFAERFALVSDDAFAFLCETCTEVNAHIKINSKGAVQDGALWYQETLPPETFMYSFVFCDKVYKDKTGITEQDLLNEFCKPDYLQFGGKASTGLGRCHCQFKEA